MLERQTLLRELRFPAKSFPEAAPRAFLDPSKRSLKVPSNVHTTSNPPLSQEGTANEKRQTQGYKDILGKEKDKRQKVGLWLVLGASCSTQVPLQVDH